MLMAQQAYAQTATPTYYPQPPAGYAPTIDSVGSGAIPALPLDIMSNGTVTYVTGGIGDEEVAELKSKEKEFNVHLLITALKGEFISDATLKIADASGTEMLNLENAGPYVYVKLPAGNYTLEATSRTGAVKQMKIKAPASGSIKKQFLFDVEGGVTTEHVPTATID